MLRPKDHAVLLFASSCLVEFGAHVRINKCIIIAVDKERRCFTLFNSLDRRYVVNIIASAKIDDRAGDRKGNRSWNKGSWKTLVG